MKGASFLSKMVFKRVQDFTSRPSLPYILLLSSPQGSQLGIWYSMMPSVEKESGCFAQKWIGSMNRV